MLGDAEEPSSPSSPSSPLPYTQTTVAPIAEQYDPARVYHGMPAVLHEHVQKTASRAVEPMGIQSGMPAVLHAHVVRTGSN